MPRLPEELLVMIIEHYLAERRQELIANYESGWDMPQAERRVVPILQSNRQLHGLVVRRLYERCIFTNHLGWMQFLEDPDLSKYALVKEIDIRCRDGDDAGGPGLSDRITAMFMQHMADQVKRDVNDGIKQMRDPTSLQRWRMEERPQLDTIRILGNDSGRLGNALDLFSAKHLIIDQESVCELPIASRLGRCSKITFLEDPLNSYPTCFHWSNLLSGGDRLRELEVLIGTDEEASISELDDRGYKSNFLASRMFQFYMNNRFDLRVQVLTFKPSTGSAGQDHRWCFPGPIASIRPPVGWPEVRFDPACLCGNGRNTQYWDGMEDSLRKMIMELPNRTQ